jgi:hypothetical protein
MTEHFIPPHGGYMTRARLTERARTSPRPPRHS